MKRAAFRWAAAGFTAAGFLAGVVLRLFPDAVICEEFLPRVAVYLLYLGIAPVFAAKYTLTVLAVLMLVLLVVRRRLVVRVVYTYLTVHLLLLRPIAVQAAILFYAGTFAAGLPVAVGLVVWRWRRGKDRSAIAGAAANALLILAACTPMVNALQAATVDELRDQWGVTRYFRPAAVYDALLLEGDQLLVSAGYGGGLFRVWLGDPEFPIRAAVTDLFRPEKMSLLDDRIYVSNNAAGEPDRPDAFSFALPDLSGRRDIFLADSSRIIDLEMDEQTGRLFLIDEESRDVTVWNALEERIEASIRLADGRRINTNEITIDSDRRRAYVCSWLLGSDLFVIDVDTLQLLRTVNVGGAVSDVAVSATGDRLYLARPLHRRIDVLDTGDFSRIEQIPVAPGARKLLLVQKSNTIVVGSYFTGDLEWIDLKDYGRRKRIRAFPRIRNLRLDARSDKVLVACQRGVFGVPSLLR